MNITVTGKSLSGEAAVIASKSDLHRLLICAALSKSPTVIYGASLSQDITATIDCLRTFAADIQIETNRMIIHPYAQYKRNPLLDCNESGSTLRFLLPVIAALGIGGRFTGRGRLAERPLSPLYELLQENGCYLSPQGKFPLSVDGCLNHTSFAIDGGVSSQFISGLLFAAPFLNQDSEIKVTGTVESYPYIQMTCAAMQKFGIQTGFETPCTFRISGNSAYLSPATVTAEGDWSNAAFWLVAAVISKSYGFTLTNLNLASLQGDMQILNLLREAGVTLNAADGAVKITDAAYLRPLQINAAQIPDLVPILAVFSCAIQGQTVIRHAQRLLYKESNRLQTVFEMITALGGKIRMTDDGLIIDGTGRLHGGTVNSYNDHRIAMSAAVASFICEEPVTIIDAQAVKKSYPDFYKEFESKGMIVCPPLSEQN
ncbi:MAG: 3-phosphoshikimate 1-carboxyvinyltransferase [Clostridia bacterium]|nr:3-phosphoshikimate 1-carboxyvinyltransferase [Clostridia bacterium]